MRSIRESNDTSTSLEPIFKKIQNDHPNDWLLSIELIELLNNRNETNLMQQVILHLENLKKQRPEIEKLISNGLELIFEKETV